MKRSSTSPAGYRSSASIILCLDDLNIQRDLAAARRATIGSSPTVCRRKPILVAHRPGSQSPIRLQIHGHRRRPACAKATRLGDHRGYRCWGRHNVHVIRWRRLPSGSALGLDIRIGSLTHFDRFGGVHRRFERRRTVARCRRSSTIMPITQRRWRRPFKPRHGKPFPRGRIVAIFQPHLFSRTRDLAY